MARFSPKPHQQISVDALVSAALASPDAQEVEMHVRSIGLSMESDVRREQALLDVIKAMPAAGNVVSACLFNLRGLARSALRSGIQRVLNQDDGFDTDCAKVAALVRLVPIDSPTAEDAQLIAHYATHPRSTLRAAAQRELRGLSLDKQQQLFEANEANVTAGSVEARNLELLLRALSPLVGKTRPH